MRGVLPVVLSVALVALAACSSSDPPHESNDAGVDHLGSVDPDVRVPPPDASMRLMPHAGVTLPAMQVGIIYVGDVADGGAPSEDALLSFLLASQYWRLLGEYGIGAAAVVGSARIPTAALLQPGDLDENGLVTVLVLQQRIAEALNGDDDSGAGVVSIPGAEAYVVLLPDGVNVALGQRGTYIYQTCIDETGYHGYDGFEPYMVLPPCPDGRSSYAAAHELTEMATDPHPFQGWASDSDIPVNGGEVADLCPQQIVEEGVIVTRLWSNQAGGCVPN